VLRGASTLQTLPMTVNEVADTAARQRKAKYDIATPAAQERLSAATGLNVHCMAVRVCGSVASVSQNRRIDAHRLV
jgi:hypothetical protein